MEKVRYKKQSIGIVSRCSVLETTSINTLGQLPVSLQVKDAKKVHEILEETGR